MPLKQIRDTLTLAGLLKMSPKTAVRVSCLYVAGLVLQTAGWRGLISTLFRLAKGEGINALHFTAHGMHWLGPLGPVLNPISPTIIIGGPVFLAYLGFRMGLYSERVVSDKLEDLKLLLYSGLFQNYLVETKLTVEQSKLVQDYEVQKNSIDEMSQTLSLLKALVLDAGQALVVLFLTFSLSWQGGIAAILLTIGLQKLYALTESEEPLFSLEKSASDNDFNPKRKLSEIRCFQDWGLELSLQNDFTQQNKQSAERKFETFKRSPQLKKGVREESLRTLRNVALTLFARIGIQKTGVKLVMLVGIQTQLQKALASVLQLKETLERGNTSFLNAEKMLIESKKDPRTPLLRFEALQKGIQVCGLSFKAADKSTPILDQIDLKLSRGKRHAISGETGAGKSSLLSILARLEKPTAGFMQVDGRDALDFSRDSWISKVGYVGQSPNLKNATFWNNLTYGLPRPTTSQKVAEILDLLELTPLIRKNPYGLNTLIGRRGIRLSSGESQRIELARALLREPEILILDEATATLHLSLENKIMKWISERYKNKLVIFVTHRPEALAFADEVHTLQQGKLVKNLRAA